MASLIAEGISSHRPDYDVRQCTSGLQALACIAEHRPDLLLLDLAMPGRDGFSILAELRQADDGGDLPVIVLTARDLESDKVRGLELGADDYITKPFSHKELVARIDAVLRRARRPAETEGEPFESGDLRIDYPLRRVTRAGREVPLTPTEYELLAQLATNAGRVMTHAELLAKVWGPEYLGEVHYLKVYVGRLRNKLEDDAARPRFLLTVRGVGYRLATP